MRTQQHDIDCYDDEFSAVFGGPFKAVRVNVRQPAPVQEIWRPSVPVLREDSPYAAFGVRDHAVGQPDQLQRRGCRDSTQDKRELEGTWI